MKVELGPANYILQKTSIYNPSVKKININYANFTERNSRSLLLEMEKNKY